MNNSYKPEPRNSMDTMYMADLEIQRIQSSIAEGELILSTGKLHGRKMSKEELMAVKRSVDNAKYKIGVV